MPLALPCRNRWCPNLQPCPAHPVVGFAGLPMPPGWPAVRAAQLAREPRCRECGADATTVDHIIQRADGGTDAPVNLRSLCKPCHWRLTGEANGASAW